MLVHKSSFSPAHGVCLSKLFLLVSPLPSLSMLQLCGFPIKLLGLSCSKFIFLSLLPLHFTPCSHRCRSVWLTTCFSSLSIWQMDLKKKSFSTAFFDLKLTAIVPARVVNPEAIEQAFSRVQQDSEAVTTELIKLLR